MPENEENYSVYIQSQSTSSTTWALFSGFTFAAIALLLTQHPNPAQIQVQITLFVFAFMLFLFLHNLNGSNEIIRVCIKSAPKLPEKWLNPRFRKIQYLFDWIGWILLGYSVVMMYLLWGFYYLSLASFLMGTVFYVMCYYDYIKPSRDYTKNHPWVRK